MACVVRHGDFLPEERCEGCPHFVWRVGHDAGYCYIAVNEEEMRRKRGYGHDVC